MTDSIPGDTSTTSSISVNGQVIGTIDSSGDRDWYAVTLTSGHSYQINLEGSPTSAGTLSDTYLRGIYDSSGSFIGGTSNDDGGISLNSLVEFSPDSTGTYYISAGAYSSNTGTYRLSLDDLGVTDDYGSTTSSHGDIEVGQAISADIESPEDVDWFAVDLLAGQDYQIDLEGSPTDKGTLSDTYFRGVYDSAGNLVSNSTNDDGGVGGNSYLEFSPASSSTYYLAAGGYGTYTGTYSLSILQLNSNDDYGESVNQAGNLSVDSTAMGNIEESGDRDWFRATLIGGRTYLIDLEGTSTAAGTLSDPYFRGVYDSSGNLIANTSNDDAGQGYNSQEEFTPSSSGTYYLSAGAYGSGTGTYSLSLMDQGSTDDYASSAAGSGSLSIDGSSSGEIEVAGDQDWFAVSLTAGTTYLIDLEGSPTSKGTLTDTFLRGVYDGNSNLLDSTTNDDGGSSLNSQLEFTAPSTGTFYISAGAYGSSTGTYTLAITDTGSIDDYGTSASTAGNVSVNGNSSGTIEEANDQDWFAVTLESGNSYLVDLQGAPSSVGTLSDTYLRGIYDTNGLLIANTSNDDGGISYESQLEFFPASTGTYYISAGAYGSSTGTYRVSVTNQGGIDDYGKTTSTAGTVSISGSVTGEIESESDEDWFAVNLQSGQSYLIDLEGSPTGAGTLMDTYLQGVYDASGSLISSTSNDDGGEGFNSQLEFTASSTGTHYIAARAYGSGTGTYTLSVNNVGGQDDDYTDSISTTGSINIGGSARGEIEVAGDRDWFATSLQSGRTYQIDLEGSPTSAGSLADTYFRGIYDSSGSLISGTSNDDGGVSYNSRLEFTASSSGTFYLSAGGYGSNAGDYILRISELDAVDDYGSSTTTAGSVTVGGIVNGNIEESADEDWFGVSLQAGQSYEISLEGSPTLAGTLSDTYLRGIYDSSGSLIASSSNDDGGVSTNSLLEFVPASSGIYYISAGAYGSATGTYKLGISGEVPAGDDFGETSSSSGSVSVGGASNGSIEMAEDRDWFSVSLQAGQEYQINLEGSPTNAGTLTDTYIRGIYDAGGNLITGTSNDDGGEGRNSQLSFTPASNGTYFISASGYGSQTGTYKLSVDGEVSTDSDDDYGSTVSTAGLLRLDNTKNAEIEIAQDTDWFSISLQAGQTYQIDLEGSPTSAGTLSDTFLRGIYDSSGTLVGNTQDDDGGIQTNSRLLFTPDSTGTFYVSAGGYSSNTGTYSLTASEVASTPGSDGTFDIAIIFDGNTAYLSYFEEAILRWQQIITDDIPDVNSSEFGLIDDLLIHASVRAIDGVGGILGQAGADYLRSDSGLPYHGSMAFDEADMAYMLQKGILQDVVLHEMGHVLGFSSWFFERAGLASGTRYTGSNTLGVYRDLIENQSVTYIPLEDEGGQGTARSHWDEEIFDTELMTGYAENSPPMPLSRLTVAVFQDLGYGVSYSFADYLSPPQTQTLSLSLMAADSSTAALNDQLTQENYQLVDQVVDIENFAGSIYSYADEKPIALSGEAEAIKLQGIITAASETSISFLDSSLGLGYRVSLSGDFQKDNPATLDDIKGEVSSISFYSNYSPQPIYSLVYNEARAVQSVLDNWQGDFLAENNVIEVKTLTAFNDHVDALSGDDVIDLGAGNDVLIGGSGNDILIAGLGDDTLNGGDGLDSAIMQGSRQDYTIVHSGDTIQVITEGPDGTDTLTGIERLNFSDISLAFDLDGNAGIVAKLLGVVLGGASLSQADVVGIALQVQDNLQLSLEQIMGLALDAVLGEDASHEEVFNLYYTNLFGQAPSPAESAQFVPLLDNGTYTPVSLGVAAAEHEINLANINLVGLAQNGLEYLLIS